MQAVVYWLPELFNRWNACQETTINNEVGGLLVAGVIHYPVNQQQESQTCLNYMGGVSHADPGGEGGTVVLQQAQSRIMNSRTTVV